MLKKLLVGALCGLTAFSTVNADELSELKEIVRKQQEELNKLNKKVERQQSVHNEALTHYIKNEVDRAIRARGTDLLTLGSNVENLTIKGDLRLRHQRRELDSAQTGQDLWRMRFRLGFVWKTNEGWEIGAGIATGSNGARSGRSTNQTLNSGGTAFETNDLNLDYAYAKHTWKHDGGRKSTLTLGQMKNPFVTTSAFWDGDLRPTGVAYQYMATGDSLNYFVTAGAFSVATLNGGTGNNDVRMYSLQAGVKTSDFIVAIAYHHLTEDFAEVQNSTRTTTVTSNAGLDNQYEIIDLYARYNFEAGEIKFGAYGQIAYNFGAKDNNSHVANISGEDDLSWVLGADATYGD